MSATSELYIVVYDCHREIRGCPVYLTDDWVEKHLGVPRFSTFQVQARQYTDKQRAEYDALRYHPGSGYLPGRVKKIPVIANQQGPPALSDFDIERITEAVVQKLKQNWPLKEGEK